MADIYNKVEAYNASGGYDEAATVGANNRKVTHDTFNYGTPRIYPLVFTKGSGDWDNYADSNSTFYQVINYLQGRGTEIYGIGEVSGNRFVIFVNWEKQTKDSGDSQEPNDFNSINILQDEINNNLGFTVTIDYGKVASDDISYGC